MSRVYASAGDDLQKLEDQVDTVETEVEQIKKDMTGALIPAGTIDFAELETGTATKQPGYTYNIRDGFTTTEHFREGPGHYYGPGANVYWTVDNLWDVMSPVMVSGVKGDAEQSFRVGEVNITKESIGLSTAADLPAVDTRSLLGLEAGAVNTQMLLDAIADRVANKLVTDEALTEKLLQYISVDKIVNDLLATDPSTVLAGPMGKKLMDLISQNQTAISTLNSAFFHRSVRITELMSTDSYSAAIDEFMKLMDDNSTYIGEIITNNGFNFVIAHKHGSSTGVVIYIPQINDNFYKFRWISDGSVMYISNKLGTETRYERPV